jgi:hypothetical protein
LRQYVASKRRCTPTVARRVTIDNSMFAASIRGVPSSNLEGKRVPQINVELVPSTRRRSLPPLPSNCNDYQLAGISEPDVSNPRTLFLHPTATVVHLTLSHATPFSPAEAKRLLEITRRF